MNVFKIDADDTFPFNTILLWSTIIGYILSLDIINTGLSLTWKYIRRAFMKKQNVGEIKNKKNVLCFNANKRNRQQCQKADRLSDKTNTLGAPYSGIIVANRGIKKYFVIFFHGLFFISSICIVLFLPHLESKSNINKSQSSFGIVLLKMNSSNYTHSLNSTSYNQVPIFFCNTAKLTKHYNVF